MEKSIATLDQSLATSAKLLRVLREAGLTDEALRQPINDRAMRMRLVKFWNDGGYHPSTSQKRAKEIMGSSYLGPEDVMKHLGVSFTDKELVQLREIPFTEAVLEACKETHVLFPGYPLSILDIRNKVANLFFDQSWYNNQSFATKEKVKLQWYLIRKDKVPSSSSKTWQQQQALLTSDEATPRACEVIFLAALNFLVTRKRLFEKLYVRCSDLGSDGDRVIVGNFGSEGIRINCWSGKDPQGYIGQTASRK